MARERNGSRCKWQRNAMIDDDLGPAVKRHADVTEIRQNLALGSAMGDIGVERVK